MRLHDGYDLNPEHITSVVYSGEGDSRQITVETRNTLIVHPGDEDWDTVKECLARR